MICFTLYLPAAAAQHDELSPGSPPRRDRFQPGPVSGRLPPTTGSGFGATTGSFAAPIDCPPRVGQNAVHEERETLL